MEGAASWNFSRAAAGVDVRAELRSHVFMRALLWLAAGFALAACAQPEKSSSFSGGAGGASTDSTASSTSGHATSASSGAGTVPTSCAQADEDVGCCVDNTVYYCSTGSNTLSSSDCGAMSMVCGWKASKGYYACVPGPAEPDPNGTYPLACGG